MSTELDYQCLIGLNAHVKYTANDSLHPLLFCIFLSHLSLLMRRKLLVSQNTTKERYRYTPFIYIHCFRKKVIPPGRPSFALAIPGASFKLSIRRDVSGKNRRILAPHNVYMAYLKSVPLITDRSLLTYRLLYGILVRNNAV